MENLKIYNSLKSVPPDFLKTITAGRLKGMSDIKPQWRIQKLTEVLGPVGFGWKLQNVSFEYVTLANEIVCNCRLEFLYKHDGEWSEPIPGTGGSKFATVESKGVYVSDEAEKMAMTDAISVATKFLGLASDVYMGYGGKYENQQNNNSQNKPPQQNNNNSQPTSNLPWLNENDSNWKLIADSIGKGQKVTMTGLNKRFKMSKATQELIQTTFKIQ